LPTVSANSKQLAGQTQLRRGTSLWLDLFSGPAFRATALRGRHDADIVVVGGGITGCAVAYRLAARGLRVVVLERNRVGYGSTAASTALLMQEPDVDFVDLAKRYGHGAARTIWQASHRAVRSMTRTLRGFQGATALHQVPSVYFTRDDANVRGLQQELKARHRAGIGGRFLAPSQLARLTGIHGAGAIVTRGNAQVDPYRACMAFAAAAAIRGARIHQHSVARRIRHDRTGVSVETDRGAVRAGQVIVATGYATPEFKPLAARFRMSHTYVVATAPIRAQARRDLGLGDVMLWDTEQPYHYARWTPDRRLLFGGGDRPRTRATTPAVRARRIDLLVDELHGLYPALREIDIEYAWEGLFATTPDGLPYIGAHRRYPKHLFALGYGGNGMTFGFLAAEILERQLRGSALPADSLFHFNRTPRDR
jgi:glycine/D-amino acid oxidase-like deaminating enzyme